RNWLGDGCMEPADAGLSLHGREVVKHMNRIGMVVDTPHSGQQTTIDAANHSKAPIMATHTACQSIHPHPRGKNNDALKAIADTGGLVGICAIPYFLGERGTLKDLLNHIDYAVDLMGVDHVGIGTDTTYPMPHYTDVPSPWEKYPKVSPYNGDAWYGAWESVQHLHTTPDEEQQQSLAWTNWPCFTVGLVARGYSEGDIAKIIGGNFLRVLRAVEESAEGLI
ncbi:MAG: dipeptidase, partial [Armatimonadetes bacterium CG_4_9_14_3_um_filter_58_7]